MAEMRIFYFVSLVVVEVLLLLAYDISFSVIERERASVQNAIQAATLRFAREEEDDGFKDARRSSLRRRLGAILPLANNSLWPVGMRERVRGTVIGAIRLDWEDRISSKCPPFAVEINQNEGAGQAVGYGLSFDDVALYLPLSANSPQTDPRVPVWLKYVGEFFGPENVFLSATVLKKPTKNQSDLFDYPVEDNLTWEVNGVTFPKLGMPTFSEDEQDFIKSNRFAPLWKKMKRYWVYTEVPGNHFENRKWALKIDPDTLLMLPYFMPLLSCLDDTAPILFGPPFDSRTAGSIVGGGCVGTTRAARGLAAQEVMKDHLKGYPPPVAEDIFISHILAGKVLITNATLYTSFDSPNVWFRKGRTANASCVLFHSLSERTLGSILALGYTLL